MPRSVARKLSRSPSPRLPSPHPFLYSPTQCVSLVALAQHQLHRALAASEAMEEADGTPRARLFHANMLQLLGRHQESLPLLRRLFTDNEPADLFLATTVALMCAFFNLGRYQDIPPLLRDLKLIWSPSGVYSSLTALVMTSAAHYILGEAENALTVLNNAVPGITPLAPVRDAGLERQALAAWQ